MGKRSALLRKPQDPDWDTIRCRAMDDARGRVIREGCSWTGDRLHQWRIVRSVNGRLNQVDLIVGNWQRTGSMRSALAALRWGKWKHA